jgi:hypothetical protein
MYAYSMAAAHHNLPHLTVLHYMVSNIDVTEEGWKHIDQLEDHVCELPNQEGIFYAHSILPTVLHYCQFYRIGEYGFQKRRLKKLLFDCNAPMMSIPPQNSSLLRYKNRDGEIIKLGKTASRRGTFMLCTIHMAINAMLEYYKQRMCTPETINRQTLVNLVSKEYY